MEDNGISLKRGESLEEWLKVFDEACFPTYSPDKGEKPYPDRYEGLKNALLPVHNKVEKGAMAAEVMKWFEKAKSTIADIEDESERRVQLNVLLESDPVVYLNNHGRGHVDKVVERVSEMLHFFDRGHLTPYEGFFLLCAIQVHDVGNVFGRDGHEKRCREILEGDVKPFIRDKFERQAIERLASVHGGLANGERDTISLLPETRPLHARTLRKRLLAALLRFGDELADDSSRADHDGLERGSIPQGSRIYHRYSEALHTVKMDRNNENQRVQLFLSYELDSALANQQFMKEGQPKYLLDELYDRTLKMERERRYCMRFLRPYFSLDSIRVEISIQHASNPFKREIIQYTLEESGYSCIPASGSIKQFGVVRSGEEQIEYLKREWGLI